jgi:hypothetical protein
VDQPRARPGEQQRQRRLVGRHLRTPHANLVSQPRRRWRIVRIDDVEVMGVTHPALLLVTGPDVPISIGNTITRDNRTYTVLKTALHRIGDTAAVKTAILS